MTKDMVVDELQFVGILERIEQKIDALTAADPTSLVSKIDALSAQITGLSNVKDHHSLANVIMAGLSNVKDPTSLASIIMAGLSNVKDPHSLASIIISSLSHSLSDLNDVNSLARTIIRNIPNVMARKRSINGNPTQVKTGTNSSGLLIFTAWVPGAQYPITTVKAKWTAIQQHSGKTNSSQLPVIEQAVQGGSIARIQVVADEGYWDHTVDIDATPHRVEDLYEIFIGDHR